MADDIGVQVTGVLKVALRFDEFPEDLRGELLQAVQYLTPRLGSKIASKVPHGETGELASSQVQQIYNDPDQVSGRITFRDDPAKVGALEYGAPGKRPRNKVSAHSMRLDHVFANRLAQPLTVMVAAHSRNLHIAAHRFLRGPLADSEGEINQAFRQAIDDAIGKTE